MRGAEYTTAPELRETLAGIFKVTAVGRGRAVTMAQLQRRPNLARYDERTIRRAINELRVLDRLVIGSSSGGGYYKVTCERERAMFLRELGGRMSALGKLFGLASRASLADDSGQLPLDDSLDSTQQAAVDHWAGRVLDGLDDDALGAIDAILEDA